MKKIFFLLFVVMATMSSCGAKEEVKTELQVVDKQKVIIDNILSRRSIRAYKPEQVPQGKIDTILQCAINAPSANNKQPWEVRVIQNAELLNKIKAINPKIFYDAPSVIIVARDTKNDYSAFDAGLLTQNILLSAESMDLGTCSLGSLARLINSPEGKEINDALKLPADYEVILGIALGYKNETPDAKPREAAKIQYIK